MTKRIIVGISGASGAIYGIRLLEHLSTISSVETHLIISAAAELTIRQETDWSVPGVCALANVVHDIKEIGASIASGSFVVHGMIVAPCSVKTLSSVAHSYSNNLIGRSADVQLKEGRPLVLLVRETPLHLGHLRLMVQAAELGATIMPPTPSWYSRPMTTTQIVDQFLGRVLLRFGIDNNLYSPWAGTP